MKKYLIICSSIIFLILTYYYLTFYTSFSLINHKEIKVLVKIEKEKFILDNNEFIIKGINFNSFLPGEDKGNKNIDKSTYLRWFKQISDMNINTIRLSNIEEPLFYESLLEYNKNNKKVLYLIQGVDAPDYDKNSSIDYFDKKLKNTLINNAKIMVDVVHGRRIIKDNDNMPSGYYFADISDYTVGYLIGTEWNDKTVEYTNQVHKNNTIYDGKYLKTKENANSFERILAEVGDNIFSYESKKYSTQKTLSFGNTPLTDPFIYDDSLMDYFNKITTIDIANIETTNEVKSGLFASYQAYSFYPDYYSYMNNKEKNSYYKYLMNLTFHYNIPVIISEFGYSTSRSTNMNIINSVYGNTLISEEEQGNMIIKDINQMMKANINGFIINSWQDNWSDNSWNTNHLVDTSRSKYWHDVNTFAQGFGILSFESGKEKSRVKIDGLKTEWNNEDILYKSKDTSLSAKYDYKNLYLLIEKENLNFNKDTLYVPFDITLKSGSNNYNDLTFNRDVDFILQINGKNKTKLLVQERYNSLKALFGKQVYSINYFEKDNIPEKNSNVFEEISLITSTQNLLKNKNDYHIDNIVSLLYTGKFIYGNGDYLSKDYYSLSDFYSKENIIEIRIPWQLLNFYDPSTMRIHDDYYENYGVEPITISNIYIGIGNKNNIELQSLELNGWNEKINYYERLKKSYQIIKEGLEGV